MLLATVGITKRYNLLVAYDTVTCDSVDAGFLRSGAQPAAT
jgi:hypothetical protein